MKRNFTLITASLAMVFCMTPAFAQVQWAGTHIVDLDAGAIAQAIGSEVTSWANAAPSGGTFDSIKVGTYTDVPRLIEIEEGMNGPKQLVRFSPSARDANCAVLKWSSTAPAGITGNDSFSAEGWVYQDNVANLGQCWFGWGDRNDAGGFAAAGMGITASWALGTGDNTTNFAIVAPGTTFPGWAAGAPTGVAKFYHYATVYDSVAQTLCFYVNGRLNVQYSITNYNKAAASAVFVGCLGRNGNATPGYALAGAVAKVRIHDGVLSAGQVLNNYNYEGLDYLAADAPEFVDVSATVNGASGYNFAWTPALTASVFPYPTWSLVGEPGGMTINPDTGLITWSPVGAIGDYNFTVHVENSEGGDDLAVLLQSKNPATPGVVDGDVVSINADFLGDGQVASFINYADNAGLVLPANNRAVRSTFANSTGGSTGQVLFAGDPTSTPYYWDQQPLPADVTDGSWSMETWVKPTILFNGTWTTIIGIGNAQPPAAFAEIIGRSTDWGIRTSSGTYYSAGVALNEWTYVASTYDGATLKLYVDGVEVVSQAVSGLTIAGASHATGSRFRISGILWGQNGSPDPWNLYTGYLARARVNSAALTPEQVLGNFDAETPDFTRAPYTITASAGPGGSIDPEGAVLVYEGEDQGFTITPDIGYEIEDVVVDTVSQGAVDSYTFLDVVDDHEISATFLELPKSTVSGLVTDGTNPIPGAIVYFNTAPNASINWSFIMETGPAGTFSGPVPAGTWYVCASADNCDTSADLAPIVLSGGTPQPGVDFVLEPNGRNIPAKEALLFSVVTESFDAIAPGDPTGNWPLFHPLGTSLTAIGVPEVEDLAGVKWEQNRDEAGRMDGYQFGPQQTEPITMNGATIIAVYRPTYLAGGNWNSIVDIMYSRLVLGIENSNGELFVNCQGTATWGGVDARIADGTKVILSLVVQANGDYVIYSNGVEMFTGNDPDGMTLLDPTISTWNAVGTGFWSYINVGRNSPDAWTVVNGNIGDVFVYRVALSDADRLTLEADLGDKFDISGLPATPTPQEPTATPKPPTSGITDWSMFE